MRVCDYCRQPRRLEEIIIPERNDLYSTEKAKWISFNKHEICKYCADSLDDLIQGWAKTRMISKET